jgi:GTP-binding protein LepA
MDTLDLEQERGITIKLQTARMIYKDHILNLIDTPGHVDFSYEVSRSVAACEGALLLVDSTQGIQAQTLSVMYKALEYDLVVIPVLNKIDLPNSDADRVKLEMMETFGFAEEDIILASGKTGAGVEEILDAIVAKVPAPKTPEASGLVEEPVPKGLQALIFDSFYHEYKGAVALIKIFQGSIQHGEKIHFIGSDVDVKPVEIGYLTPSLLPQKEIKMGEVGYVATGLKDIKEVHVGDTIGVSPLMGYKPPQPMVYASLYPVEASDFPDFQSAIEKLSLNDAALTYQKESSQALGTGFLCGFLGLLHLEIIQERLSREFDVNLISTMPTVEYRVHLTTKDISKLPNANSAHVDDKGFLHVRMAAEFPDGSLYDYVMEPWVNMEIFTPEEYIGPVMELCKHHRGIYKSMDFTTRSDLAIRHAVIKYEIPTAEIIINFFDKLKSISRGYASMDYNFFEYRNGSIVRVGVLINTEEAEALSFLCHREFAERRGREMVEKLAEAIPKQMFKVPIQAAIGGKIIARADIQAYRKDVTAKLYGGDETRKKKLLEKQKKGKKKMKAIGKVEIPKEAFLAALKMD